MDENKKEQESVEEVKAEEVLDDNQNDDFVIGQGFKLSDYEEPVRVKAKTTKNYSALKNIIWILCILIVSVGIAFGVIYAGADYLGIGFGRGYDTVIEVEPGSSAKSISKKLQESGAVKCPIIFRLYTKLKGYDSQFKYGVYNFNNEAGYEDLSKMLIEDGAKIESVRVTIPEMSDVDDIAKLLEEKGVCTKSDFLNEVQHGVFKYDFLDIEDIPFEKVYYRLEGYLFPDTYDFYCYDSKECAHLAVDKMLSTLNSKLTSDLREELREGKYSLHEVMTMASIIELEAGGSPSEMKNVSAVFYNRLESKNFSTLGSSPTRKYPYGNGRYNTYEVEGLPPGPLCSPSLGSIIASLRPAKNLDYYYFVTDKSMKFYYNKTLSQHNSTIAKLQRENNWIYED